MKNLDLEAFKERIKNEANLFHSTTYSSRGFENGKLEASQWGYEKFLKYQSFMDIKKGSELKPSDIEELYFFMRSSENVRIMEIHRIEGAQGVEGVYRVVERKNDDLPENLQNAERVEYLTGWFRGIEHMWRIALKALSW